MALNEYNFKEEAMNYFRQPARLVLLAVLSLVTIVTLVKLSRASVGTISKSDLSGNWQVTLFSSGGGCGVGTALVTFTLNASGVATNATEVSHSAGCGDTTSTGNTFTVSSLAANGSGTAGLSCGASCGFTFRIQVAPDRSVFKLVDVTDPNNFIGGVAIHQ
jgi:hypothetical protein